MRGYAKFGGLTHRLTLTGDSLRTERPKTARKEKNIDPS
jgi:hypothetical protein